MGSIVCQEKFQQLFKNRIFSAFASTSATTAAPETSRARFDGKSARIISHPFAYKRNRTSSEIEKGQVKIQ